MKKLGYIIIIFLFGYFLFTFFGKDKSEITILQYNSELIQKQIENVSKLIVTEGHFAEVVTYKDKKSYFTDYLSFEKKALVVINAKALISYDLKQMNYEIDEKNQTITILHIPKPQIDIIPDIQFYDVNQSTFNAFSGEDYNKISKSVKEDLRKKIEKSSLVTNAQNRLITELSNLLFTANSTGWTIIYNGNTIDETNFKELIP